MGHKYSTLKASKSNNKRVRETNPIYFTLVIRYKAPIAVHVLVGHGCYHLRSVAKASTLKRNKKTRPLLQELAFIKQGELTLHMKRHAAVQVRYHGMNDRTSPPWSCRTATILPKDDSSGSSQYRWSKGGCKERRQVK